VSDQAAELRAAAAGLIEAAVALAAKHVYLDPHDAAPDSMVRAYCSLCLRYGVNHISIDHAPSCAVGRVIVRVNELRAQLLEAGRETGSRDQGAGIRDQGSGISQQDSAPERRLRIEYFVESPRGKFNPYMNPCPAQLGGAVCELEREHSGAHCSDGAVWADHGQVWVDGSRRLA
jgi:hypothetical protein